MKIILTDIQYNTLKEMTEESLRNFLYKLWDTQKKRGEEPSLDDIIYQVTEIGRDTREDYSTIRPIWYRYDGGFNKLFKKLKDEILNKTFDLVVPEIGLNTKIKVIELESVVGGLHYFNEMVDIFCNVDNQGVIDFYIHRGNFFRKEHRPVLLFLCACFWMRIISSGTIGDFTHEKSADTFEIGRASCRERV